MSETVHVLSALMSLLCAFLLARAWRRAPSRLLLWSAVCFAALATNNIIVVVDLMLLPAIDLRLWRLLAAALGLLPLLWVLITDSD